jgi:predicted RNA binding protein YcfA (HicA-like mRNA interferase family)
VRKLKLLRKALSGTKNFRFADLCQLATAVGYRLDRVSGSHHIFIHPMASRPLNIQNVRGQAKPYQVRQLLRDIEEFNLQLETDE